MKRNYIGFSNSFHDSAIAIVDSSGRVVFAEATERPLQYKRAFNIAPDLFHRTGELIARYCEPDAELVLAYSWSEGTEALVRRNLSYIEREMVSLKERFGTVPSSLGRQMAMTRFSLLSTLNMLSQRGRTVEYELSQLERDIGQPLQLRGYEHHLTHAATACFSSPYSEAVCAIVDGYGEDRAAAGYVYRDGRLEEIRTPRGSSPGSLGAFFTYVCDTCGFGQLSGEEWKVMGLAPYGWHDEEIYQFFRGMIHVNGLQIEFCDESRHADIFQRMHEMRRRKGQPAIEMANVAYAGQKVFSEVLFQYLNNLRERVTSDNLVLGGGCALNSSANGRILENTSFKSLHVFAAPADDGNAIGAALLAFSEDHPDWRPHPGFQSPYLGSRMSKQVLDQVVQFGRIPKLSVCDDPATRAAELLAQGMIIGWVQGAAEFGPRALGNRSILADPRSASIKEEINAKVKFREEFRPFAPSILHEYGPEYFENYQETPYMERTLKFRHDIMHKVPGVVHEDGTGRLQSVRKEWNERYHRLISHFHQLTGVPLVLNTSFNVMGKPISHSVEDALAVFYTSGLDALFIDDVLIEK
ncbi:carbamoyltransferase family protein [Chromobacterium alticapitis]|nr:carbamoyltransferase C-terminal domain-containing protein [Chromobacterium alticapitis]